MRSTVDVTQQGGFDGAVSGSTQIDIDPGAVYPLMIMVKVTGYSGVISVPTISIGIWRGRAGKRWWS